VKRWWFFLGGLSGLLAFASVTGCSGSDGNLSLGGGSPDGGAGVGSSANGDSAGDSGRTEGGDDKFCATIPTLSLCETCCYGSHSAGTSYLVTRTAACECGSDGPCQNECETTLCATPVVASDSTCTACVADSLSGDCRSVLTECSSQPDCGAVLACLQTCSGKP
jgi:hypothetical protein